MENWKEYRIGKFAEIGRGSSPRPITDKRFFENGTIPWIKIADATAAGRTIYKTKEYVNEYGASFSRLLKKGSLILSASGVSLGIPRFLGVDGCIHDGWLYLENIHDIDVNFLYYKLLTLRTYFDNLSYGAAIQNINTDIFSKTKIQLPPLPTQRRIASILSTYDALIQNYKRQIAALQSAASELYKEWFVRFRFPGYKNAKFDNGLPVGWKVEKLGNLFEITSSKRVYEEDYVKEGIPFYRSKEIIELSNNQEITTELFISKELYNRFKNKFGVPKEYDILITSVGSIGNSYQVRKGDVFYFKDGNLTWIKSSSNKILAKYLKYWLQSDEGRSSLNASTIGTSQCALTIEKLKKIKLCTPDIRILEQFQCIVEQIDMKVKNLQQQITNLTTQRDLLLPRLMSGKLSVE